jgi:hypothetical protein
MLSDTLFNVGEELSKELFHYTSGTFKDHYEIDIILECQDIVNRINALRIKLDTPPNPNFPLTSDQ